MKRIESEINIRFYVILQIYKYGNILDLRICVFSIYYKHKLLNIYLFILPIFMISPNSRHK